MGGQLDARAWTLEPEPEPGEAAAGMPPLFSSPLPPSPPPPAPLEIYSEYRSSRIIKPPRPFASSEHSTTVAELRYELREASDSVKSLKYSFLRVPGTGVTGTGVTGSV